VAVDGHTATTASRAVKTRWKSEKVGRPLALQAICIPTLHTTFPPCHQDLFHIHTFFPTRANQGKSLSLTTTTSLFSTFLS